MNYIIFFLYDGIVNADKQFCGFTGMFVNTHGLWGSSSNLLFSVTSRITTILLHDKFNSIIPKNLKKKSLIFLGVDFLKNQSAEI